MLGRQTRIWIRSPASKHTRPVSNAARTPGDLKQQQGPHPLRMQKLDWDLKTICDKIDDGGLNLLPEYQRDYIMPHKVASRQVRLQGRVS